MRAIRFIPTRHQNVYTEPSELVVVSCIVYTPVHCDKPFDRGTHMSFNQEQPPGDALKQWLELAGMSASAFSRLIPCSVSLPGQWARGDATPSYRMACRVEQITDGMVPRTLWFPPGPKIESTNEIEDMN